MSNSADIYIITCTVTHKVYVGSAKRSKVRLDDHWAALANGRHENPHLQRAWNKYGASCFEWEVIETCPLAARWVREQHWIDQRHACDRRYGFNIMHSAQVLLPSPAMSKILKKYWKRRWEDSEYRERRTDELKSLVSKPGVRAKMQASKLASWQDPEYRRIQSEKHRQYAAKNKKKMSANTKNLWNDPEYRAKQMAERKARFQDPAFRAKLSKAALNRWSHTK